MRMINQIAVASRPRHCLSAIYLTQSKTMKAFKFGTRFESCGQVYREVGK